MPDADANRNPTRTWNLNLEPEPRTPTEEKRVVGPPCMDVQFQDFPQPRLVEGLLSADNALVLAMLVL